MGLFAAAGSGYIKDIAVVIERQGSRVAGTRARDGGAALQVRYVAGDETSE